MKLPVLAAGLAFAGLVGAAGLVVAQEAGTSQSMAGGAQAQQGQGAVGQGGARQGGCSMMRNMAALQERVRQLEQRLADQPPAQSR